jgi:DNA-binding transcriptional ArsR family regulator
VPHQAEHAVEELNAAEAETLAEAMRAFGTASRLLLLWALREQERTVEEPVAITGVRSSAASQQLRLLRQARLVAVRRVGRNAFYRLHDHHVAELLTAMRSHHDHLHLPKRVLTDELALAPTATRGTS